jgi:RIO-like serine/threonine protein kinase
VELANDLPNNFAVWLKNQGITLTSIKKISGGYNNKLYRLNTANNSYLLKLYGYDQDFRLKREFTALSTLPNIGFTEVPKAIAVNWQDSYAIYTFIKGKKIQSGNLTKSDLEKIAKYVIKLQSIKPADIKNDILDAHMACFSIQDYLQNIKFRLNEYDRTIASHPHPILKDFDDRYHLSKFVKEKIRETISDIDSKTISKQISRINRRLSPVDFGVHNMLYDQRKIFFLDFERFGWDDPRRLVAEFINHDQATRISDKNKKYFLEYYKKHWNIPNELKENFDFIVNLFAIDWLTVIIYSITDPKIKVRKFVDQNFIVEDYLQNQINKMVIRINKLV